MFTKEEMQERKSYIGASEAASVIGLSRWGTPLSVWADKTGRIKDSEEEQLHQWLGCELEEVVAKRFTIETGKKVHRVSEAFVHKKYPFLRAHIDRKVEGENAILQCKTCSPFKAKEWDSEEVPHEYIVQELHELACSGYDRAYIAVLIGNQDYKIKIVERDEALISQVIEKEVHFWNTFVIPNVMPVQITKNDEDTLYNLFPLESEGKEIELDDTANRLVESIQAMGQDMKVLKDNIDKSKNELRALLKDCEVGKSDLWCVTWKAQSAVVLNTDKIKLEEPTLYRKFGMESLSRVLRIKAVKSKGGK
jgi:putative phage-type endonuclease